MALLWSILGGSTTTATASSLTDCVPFRSVRETARAKSLSTSHLSSTTGPWTPSGRVGFQTRAGSGVSVGVEMVVTPVLRSSNSSLKSLRAVLAAVWGPICLEISSAIPANHSHVEGSALSSSSVAQDLSWNEAHLTIASEDLLWAPCRTRKAS